MDSLTKLFEHNNWANQAIIQACYALSDAQLDAQPQSATAGSIRDTLNHMVMAQIGYLKLLALPLEARRERIPIPPFADLEMLANESGADLLDMVADEPDLPYDPIQTRDGYKVASWVLIVQIINHATEHREQIKCMLSALGVTPPEIDGWSFGEDAGALVLIE